MSHSNTTPKTYNTNPDFDYSAPYMSDDDYNLVVDSVPMICVDVLLVDRANQKLWLVERTIKPAEGLWFIGGRIHRDMEPLQAATKVVKRETGTDIDKSDLQFLTVSRFAWDYRKDDHNNKGRVDFNLCYVYEPNADQIQHMADNLDEKEYNTDFGVKAYSRSDIEGFFADNDQSVNKQVLLDYYDQVFGN